MMRASEFDPPGDPSARIGVISDTHGLLRPEATAALAGVDVIVHAGDIGKADVIAALADIAPVHAIRGNIDRGAWADRFPATCNVDVAGMTLHLVHDIKTLDIDPTVENIDAVICGHSHQPSIDWRDGVLYFNPGSAGPRRFKLPVCVGYMEVRNRSLTPEIVKLI